MPAGLNASVTGYLTFVAVKWIGYSLYAVPLQRAYGVSGRVPAISTARTALGMAVGAAYVGIWSLAASVTSAPVLYLIGLIPLRIAEWWLIIWWFLDRPLRYRAVGWRYVGIGIAWSFVCDLPALMGYLLTGGMTIC